MSSQDTPQEPQRPQDGTTPHGTAPGGTAPGDAGAERSETAPPTRSAGARMQDATS